MPGALPRPQDQAKEAYRKGLALFEAAVQRADPKDEDAFRDILALALGNFGMTASALAQRVGHNNGTISKWLNNNAVPAQSTREIVFSWILAEVRRQLDKVP